MHFQTGQLSLIGDNINSFKLVSMELWMQDKCRKYTHLAQYLYWRWDLAQSTQHSPEVLWSQDQTSLADLALDIFPIKPVAYSWYFKGHAMYYPLYGIVHTKNVLVSNLKSCPWCGGSRFSISLSVVLYHMSNTITTINKMC